MTRIAESTTKAMISFILRFCHQRWLPSFFPERTKTLEACCRFSVLSTRVSILSPRSRTFSMLSIFTLFTSATCAATWDTLPPSLPSAAACISRCSTGPNSRVRLPGPAA